MPAARWILTFVAILLLFTAPSAVRGEWHTSAGRWLGFGWSDGYHARPLASPRRYPSAPGPKQPLPWWATPAAETDAQPHPAAVAPTTSSLVSPASPGTR